jgi:hypothetical protein
MKKGLQVEEAIEMQERKRLEDTIKELPEDLRKELEDFADKFTSKEGEDGNFYYEGRTL